MHGHSIEREREREGERERERERERGRYEHDMSLQHTQYTCTRPECPWSALILEFDIKVHV